MFFVHFCPTIEWWSSGPFYILADHNAHTIRVSPVPKSCPPLLLQNLCPTSVAVRIPSGRNHRYCNQSICSHLWCWTMFRRFLLLLTHLFHSSLWTFPRYAFIEFRTSAEAEAAAKEVTGKLVVGKAIRAVVCSERPSRTVANWKQPTERELDDFDLTTLYVSCLPRLTERTTLAQIFRTADKIKYESLPDGTSKG